MDNDNKEELFKQNEEANGLNPIEQNHNSDDTVTKDIVGDEVENTSTKGVTRRKEIKELHKLEKGKRKGSVVSSIIVILLIILGIALVVYAIKIVGDKEEENSTGTQITVPNISLAYDNDISINGLGLKWTLRDGTLGEGSLENAFDNVERGDVEDNTITLTEHAVISEETKMPENTTLVVCDGVTLVIDANFTISENSTLEIEPNAKVVVSEGVTLTNDGTINNNGTINKIGELVNNGVITGDGEIIEGEEADKITVPKVTVPNADNPNVNSPNTDNPEITKPTIDVPKVTVPHIQKPNIGN